MSVIAPKRRPGKAYFGCGGAACLGLVFWAIIACCLVFTVVGMSTEINSGNTELVSTFYALSQIMVGSLAFSFSMGVLLVVFLAFGLYRQTRPFPTQGEAQDVNTVLLFFFLFFAGMILAAALPTLALEFPRTNGLFVVGAILMGGAYLVYGMLMLWLTLTAYESYRNASV